MNKVLILSHRADTDGFTPVILSKLVFSKMDFILLENDEVDNKILELLSQHLFDEYDKVIMVDLCPSERSVLPLIENNITNFLVFDHHISRIDMNQYPFIHVIDIDEHGKKQCGTSLYYHYLLKYCPNPILKKESVKQLVELVRSIDTWEWKETNYLEAKWLGNIAQILGRDYFINHYYEYLLTHDKFEFTEQELYLLKTEDIRIQNYIDKKEQEMISIELENYQVAVLFAEQYMGELGNTLAERYQNIYDFIIIINISKGISYRSINDIDVSIFAKQNGGGGHFHASGSPLPEHLKEEILLKCFPKANIKENENG